MTSSTSTPTGEFASQKDLLHLSEAVQSQFEKSDEIIQKGRNTLKKVNFEGIDCVVKAFFIPRFPQNFGYGLFFNSKAKKSYNNGNKLLKLGFSTPKPVGYFEYRSGGKLRASYYICEFASDTQTLDVILKNLEELGKDADEDLIQQFSAFCYKLHKHGILHRDFNPKNILISDQNGVKDFALVDINRITWLKSMPLEKCMASLSRLPFSDQTKSLMLKHYSKLAGVEIDQCLTLLDKAERKTEAYFRNKRRLRKWFPKK